MQNLSEKGTIKTKPMLLVGPDGQQQQVFVPVVTLPDNTKIITKTKVSKMLGVSINTVIKYCKEGKLRTTTDGKITEQSLAEYLNN